MQDSNKNTIGLILCIIIAIALLVLIATALSELNKTKKQIAVDTVQIAELKTKLSEAQHVLSARNPVSDSDTHASCTPIVRTVTIYRERACPTVAAEGSPAKGILPAASGGGVDEERLRQLAKQADGVVDSCRN